MNDLYDSVPRTGHNDKLSLLYKANCDNYVAVRTPVGQTDRKNIREIVMQGGTWGPLKCSNSMDKIGKLCENTGEHMYKYKNIVQVPILTMVDDTFAISECGQKSVAINQFINSHIELKKLRMHTPDATGKTKCHKIHVGKPSKICPKLQVHGTPMKEVDHDVYLGDIISADGKNDKTVKDRIGRGIGKIKDIMTILEKVTLGEHYFKTAILLRESMFINSVLISSDI